MRTRTPPPTPSYAPCQNTNEAARYYRVISHKFSATTVMISWPSILSTSPPPPRPLPTPPNNEIDLTYLRSKMITEAESYYQARTLFPRVMLIHIYSSVYMNVPQVHTFFSEECHAPDRFLQGTCLITLPSFHPQGIKQLYKWVRRYMIRILGQHDVAIIEDSIMKLFELFSNDNTHAFRSKVRVSERMTEGVIHSIFGCMKQLNFKLHRHNIDVSLMAPFQVVYDVVLMKSCFHYMFRELVMDPDTGGRPTQVDAIVKCLKTYFDSPGFKTIHKQMLFNLRYRVHQSQQDLAEICRTFIESSIAPPPSPLSHSGSVTSSAFDDSVFDFSTIDDEEEDQENPTLGDISNSPSPTVTLPSSQIELSNDSFRALRDISNRSPSPTVTLPSSQIELPNDSFRALRDISNRSPSPTFTFPSSQIELPNDSFRALIESLG